MLPPRWLRRLVLAPAMVVLTLIGLLSLPVWVLAAALASTVLPGRLRALRVLWLVVLHLVLEAFLLIWMLALWVLSGFGRAMRTPRFERAHYDLVQAYLLIMLREAGRVLRLRVVVEGPEPDSYTGRPLVVFCRHAGPGDSFLLAHALVNWYDREPRIVMKDTLQWDPAIDVLLNRLPNRFISTTGMRAGIDETIRVLATGLDDNDAFVIFPEGGNFTARRRARAIAHLREKGLLGEADKAERMRHVLAPKPGGVVAALAAAPDADVVWVAHSGLDHLISIGDIWRELPMDMAVHMRWWQVPAGEVPVGREAQISWLYDWWARIDEWIGVQRAEREAGV